MLAYVLLLSKYVLTAYDQPSFSLHFNGFTDQSLAVSFNYHRTSVTMLRPW